MPVARLGDRPERAGSFALDWLAADTSTLLDSLPAPAHLGGRLVRFCEVRDTALILGSSQPDSSVDAGVAASLGVALLRRRAGGGAVLVAPAGQLWVDVFIPANDELFETDVGRSFHWLGDAFAAALHKTGAVSDVAVHNGPSIGTRWSRLLCFCGVGPGEVLVQGRKVLGLAQRRNRFGAWLHAMVPLAIDPDRTVALLALAENDREAATQALGESAAAVSAAPEVLTELLVEELRRLS